MAALEHSRGDRERRAEKMAARLRELGYELDGAQLAARTAQGKTIGRPHLAQAATSHPANQARLREEGLLEPTKFLVEYLIDGKPAFVDREAPSVQEAVALIHDAGGLAVWAHPFWDIPELDDVRATLDTFRGYGIDGVEAFYPSFTEEQVRFLARECAGRGLLTTGSSDFHGPLIPAHLRPEAVDTTQGVATIFPALTLTLIRLFQGYRPALERPTGWPGRSGPGLCCRRCAWRPGDTRCRP